MVAAADEAGLRGHKSQMSLVAQALGLCDGENTLVDATGGGLGLSAKRERRRWRCRWRNHPLASLVPEVPGDRVLMPAAIIVRRSRDRRRVIGVEPGTGTGNRRRCIGRRNIGRCLYCPILMIRRRWGIRYQSRFIGFIGCNRWRRGQGLLLCRGLATPVELKTKRPAEGG